MAEMLSTSFLICLPKYFENIRISTKIVATSGDEFQKLTRHLNNRFVLSQCLTFGANYFDVIFL